MNDGKMLEVKSGMVNRGEGVGNPSLTHTRAASTIHPQPTHTMDIRTRILQLLKSPDYHPLRRNELASELNLKGDDRRDFRHVLGEMVQRGEVVRVRKNRFVLPQEADLVVGRITMNERGFGFVVPEVSDDQPAPPSGDIYVAAEDTWTALHGDTVVVRLIQGSTRRAGAGKSE